MLDAALCRMKAQVLGINVSQLSALCGVPPSKLSLFLGGTRGINNTEIADLRSTLDDIERLIETAQPWPLSFRDTRRIAELIQRMKLGEFDRKQA